MPAIIKKIPVFRKFRLSKIRQQACPIYWRYVVLFVLVPLILAAISGNAQPAPGWDQGMVLSYSFEPEDRLLTTQKIAAAKKMSDTHPDSARQLLEEALTASRNRFDAAGMRNALRPLLSLLSASERARLLHELKLECSLTPPLWGVLPVIYNAMAKGYQLKGHYGRAARLYMKAMSPARRYIPAYLAVIYNNYGSLLLLLPENDKHLQSLYYLNKAEKIARQQDDRKTITCVLCNKGKVFRNLKQYDKSLRLSVQALGIARQNGYRQWEYVLLNNIGDLYYLQDHPRQALRYLKQAEQMNDSTMDPYYQNMSVFTLGEVYESLGKNHKATAYFQTALETAKTHHIGRDLIAANRKLAHFYARQHNYAKAYQHLQKYSRLNDSLKNEEMLKHIQDLSVKYQTAESNKKLLQNELYIAHQRQLIQQKNRILMVSFVLAIFIIVFLISRFRHKKKLLLKEEKIKEMQAILHGEEKERTRLARELHDGIGGMLAAANMHLEVAQKSDLKNNDTLSEVSRLIGNTSEEVRNISHNLMPAALFRQNLEEALRYYCNAIKKYDRLNIDLNIYGSINTLPAFEMTFIFRAIQELIQNIIRHAGASHAIISLERTHNRIQIIIEDDGAGFDPRPAHWGFGLGNLSHRINALKGTFNLQSEPGAGTSITIEFSIGG